jgi:hypothetical protein
MYSFKKSLTAVGGVLVLVAAIAVLMPLVSQGQGGTDNAPPLRGPRKFYLTKTFHDGSQTLSACDPGYHMASLWEIFDPSNLRYDTQLGVTHEDSGSGPPVRPGWIRTGNIFPNGGGNLSGFTSCGAWTSSSSSNRGSLVGLVQTWESDGSSIRPWEPGTLPCNVNANVWCVQD